MEIGDIYVQPTLAQTGWGYYKIMAYKTGNKELKQSFYIFAVDNYLVIYLLHEYFA